MNRVKYYNYIEEKLDLLSRRIDRRGKLNILDYHIHSEYFYRDLFNLLYDWNLKNVNDENQNVEGIDLEDNIKHIIIQVSATNTKAKIQHSLDKLNSYYNNYSFKFISIAKSTENIRDKSYKVPQGISFDPITDIYDLDRILFEIKSFEIKKLELVYSFIWKELGKETSTQRLESNITTIIKLLANTNLSVTNNNTPKAFDIDKKINFNRLKDAKAIIAQYKIYQAVVNNIYVSFDKMGQNKSLFVLNRMHKIYLENAKNQQGDQLFNTILNELKKEVAQSANVNELTSDEIDMCVDIIVVDAFVRCKIFENPENYNYATI